MIDVNDLRKGTTFVQDNSLYRVLEYSHMKPGRGKATIRVKTRNLRTGSTTDMTFISGDRVQDVRLDTHMVQYLYSDGDLYYFMDTETYDQPGIRAEVIQEAIPYLKEGMEMKLTLYDGEPIDIDLPTVVEQRIVQAEAAVRGDTATGLTIKVKTETGLMVQVPSFVTLGDTIRIDTRTGEYVTRV